MKKFLLIFAFVVPLLAYTPTNLKTVADVTTSIAYTSSVGGKIPIVVNLASTDYVVTVPIRMITATSGTVIKVDIHGTNGTIIGCYIPPNLPVLNVTKIYKTGTDCTNILIWPLE